MTLIKDVSLFEFPPIKTPIFMENLDCESSEISLIECPHHVLHQCDHSQDVAVQCFGKCGIFISCVCTVTFSMSYLLYNYLLQILISV